MKQKKVRRRTGSKNDELDDEDDLENFDDEEEFDEGEEDNETSNE